MITQDNYKLKLQNIYSESADFFTGIDRKTDFGFKIFNSPPIFSAPVLFIGYQPGGGLDDYIIEKNLGTHLTYPPKSEYATSTWKLAKVMRSMLQPDIDLSLCVGLNAIFLRSPTIKRYRDDLSKDSIAKVESFCITQIVKILNILKPQKIIVIGMSTLQIFCESTPDLSSQVNTDSNKIPRILTREGRIGDRNVLGTLHLSGCHISNIDRESIARRVKDYCKN